MLRLQLLETKTGCIRNVINVEGTQMKQADKDGLYRGDILEGMMTGQKPLEFIPLNELSNERSGGRVVSWITSWCKDNIGTV